MLCASAALKLEEVVRSETTGRGVIPIWMLLTSVALELPIGLALLVRPQLQPVRATALVFLLVATSLVVTMTVAGLPPGACRCFGRLSVALDNWHLVVNACLLALLALSLSASPQPVGSDE